MANQTSAIQRKQETPHLIGRLMDVDFFGGHFSIPRCIIVTKQHFWSSVLH